MSFNRNNTQPQDVYRDYMDFLNNFYNFNASSMSYIRATNDIYNNINNTFQQYLYYYQNTNNLYSNITNIHPQPIIPQPVINSEYFENITNANREYIINLKLKKSTFNEIQNPINTTCGITQNELLNNNEVGYIEGCGHIFEYDDIYQWLSDNYTCPICRHNIIQNTGLLNIKGANDESFLLYNNEFRQYVSYLLTTGANGITIAY